MKSIIRCLIICSLLIIPAGGWADSELLSLDNKYIKVYINNSAEETGRFAVDVTSGDSNRTDDDGKPLIYGHPKPWTSFTTIRINGQNFVFGKATTKRAGAGVPGGIIVEPPKLAANQLTMKCQYNSVTVKQILDLARSPSTGALDTARIRYVFCNEGSTPVEIGARILLDTMVGDNDGAPFRLGDKEITYEYSGAGKEIPDFWQAFDSLTKPAVIAQGTLRGGDISAPDRIIFTNWGKAADHPWDLPLQPGTSFMRLGEDELDSAVAMYWMPRKINPGEQFELVAYLGLGGVTFAPGKTFLGISAPAEVRYNSANSTNFSIIMYLEHHGEAKAKNVQIDLILPAGLECVSTRPQVQLPELTPGVTKQIAWEIKPNGFYQGNTAFQIKVTGDGLEANQVSRKIRIIGPPVLNATLTMPSLKITANRFDPYPVTATINLKNSGESGTFNLKAVISGESGVELAEGEPVEKFAAELAGGAQTKLTWQLVPLGGFKTGKFQVTISGDGVTPLVIPGEMTIPALPTKISFSDPGKLSLGQVFSLDLLAFNLKDAQQFKLNVKYNSQQFRLIHVSRGTFLVEGDTLSKWWSGTVDKYAGRVNDIRGIRVRPFRDEKTVLLSLNFRVISTGAGRVEVENLQITDSHGDDILYDLAPGTYQIEEGPK
jgi:hypothetical protein